jgi:hypothetical protein
MENILINVDSRFRNTQIYPSASKFTVKLSNTVKNIMYIRLSSVEMPNLYLTFTNAKNNTSMTIHTNGESYLIHIDDGFYNSSQMLQAIQTELDKIPGNFTIKLNLANGFVTFQSDNTFSIDCNANLPYPSLCHHLGCRNSVCLCKPKIVNGVTKNYITYASQMDVIGDNYLFLKVNDYGKIYNFNLDNNNVSESQESYLGKVIMTSNKAEKNFDNNNLISKRHIFRQPVNINRLDIELLDPYSKLVEMLNMNFSFTLEIGVIYDSAIYKDCLKSLSFEQ